jgi:hypothetical protein
MNMEELVQAELAGENKILGENLPLCPPQIAHNLTWDRTQAAIMRSQ